MTKNSNYMKVLKNPECRKLLLSVLINRLGDSVDAIAFTWLAYALTHSASWSALIYGLNILPSIIVQPLAGPLVERLDKKKVIVATHLIRAVMITSFALMYFLNMVNPYMMAAFTLLITTVESFNLPAAGAFIPSIVQKEDYSYAMSLNSSLGSIVSIIGTGLGGIIVAGLGVHTAMLIDAATFFISAAIVMFIRPLKNAVTDLQSAGKANAEGSTYFESLKAGFRYVFGNRVILNFCLVAVLMNFFLVPLNALQAPIADEIYGLGSGFLSLIGITGSIGPILGSLIMPVVNEKYATKKIIVTCSLGLGAFMYFLSLGGIFKGAALPGYLYAGICFFAMTFFASLVSGVISVQFVNSCDKRYLARAGAVLNAMGSGASPVASILVSFLALSLSPGILIGTCGILIVILIIGVSVSNLNFEMERKEIQDAA